MDTTKNPLKGLFLNPEAETFLRDLLGEEARRQEAFLYAEQANDPNRKVNRKTQSFQRWRLGVSRELLQAIDQADTVVPGQTFKIDALSLKEEGKSEASEARSMWASPAEVTAARVKLGDFTPPQNFYDGEKFTQKLTRAAGRLRYEANRCDIPRVHDLQLADALESHAEKLERTGGLSGNLFFSLAAEACDMIAKENPETFLAFDPGKPGEEVGVALYGIRKDNLLIVTRRETLEVKDGQDGTGKDNSRGFTTWWKAELEKIGQGPNAGIPLFNDYARPFAEGVWRAALDRHDKLPPGLREPGLGWLYSHCLAIGMAERSLPKTLESDIGLFTIRIQQMETAARLALEESKKKHYETSQELERATEKIKEWEQVAGPILAFGQENGEALGIRWGGSITTCVLRILKEQIEPETDTVVNYQEATQLAGFKRKTSNLARCYLGLRKTVESLRSELRKTQDDLAKKIAELGRSAEVQDQLQQDANRSAGEILEAWRLVAAVEDTVESWMDAGFALSLSSAPEKIAEIGKLVQAYRKTQGGKIRGDTPNTQAKREAYGSLKKAIKNGDLDFPSIRERFRMDADELSRGAGGDL